MSATSPRLEASDVAINTLIAASFSESMNSLTLTDETFTLACPAGTPIAGIVDYAANGNVATFTPASHLPVGAICTATIATGVEDLTGNAMADAHLRFYRSPGGHVKRIDSGNRPQRISARPEEQLHNRYHHRQPARADSDCNA